MANTMASSKAKGQKMQDQSAGKMEKWFTFNLVMKALKLIVLLMLKCITKHGIDLCHRKMYAKL